MKTLKNLAIFIVLLVSSLQICQAQLLQPGSSKTVGWDQNIGDTIPMDATFITSHGDSITIGEIVDKPTVFNFVFYSCPGMCDPLLEDVSRVIGESELSLGQDYNVVTLSFDTKDKPERSYEKKQNYVQVMRPEAQKHWYFLNGDSANIQRLTGAAGFRFKRQGTEFSHPLGLAIVSSNGKITRYLFGTDYLPFDLKMAIGEAQEGKERPVANKVLQLCFNYNPNTQSYSVNVTSIMGGIILFGLVIFVIIFLIRRRRKIAKS